MRHDRSCQRLRTYPHQRTVWHYRPPGTRPDATLYLPLNITELGPWDPGKVAITNRGDGIWDATITVPEGTDIQYRYTAASERPSRTGARSPAPTTAASPSTAGSPGPWSSMTLPPSEACPRADTHLGRHPVLAGPAGGAHHSDRDGVDREVPALHPADGRRLQRLGDGHRSVRGVDGTVADPAPGALVWTPAAALAPGSCTVTVARVSSTGGGGVPIRKPYTTTDTIP